MIAALGTTGESGVLRAITRRTVALRVVFGVVWAVDAYLKWRPSFRNRFMETVSEGAAHHPSWLSPWFDFWHDVIAGDPRLFAYSAAVIETLLAVALILGLARRWVYVAGALWSLAIWSIPEGFGTPFMPGATDIGAAIMYVVLFGALYSLESALGWRTWALDLAIVKRPSASGRWVRALVHPPISQRRGTGGR